MTLYHDFLAWVPALVILAFTILFYIDSESSGERNWKSPNRNACIPGLWTTLCDPYGNGTVWEVRPERVKVPYMKPEGS